MGCIKRYMKMFKFMQLILLHNKRGLLLRGVDAVQVVNPKQPNRA